MAATVSDVSKAIRTALTAVPGLRVVEYIPDSLNPPMATVGVDTVTYHGAFSGGNPEYQFRVVVVVARASDRLAQKRLDDYLSYGGAQSIRQALEKDPSLGGCVQTSQVVSGGNVQNINVNDVIYLSVDFAVEVYA